MAAAVMRAMTFGSSGSSSSRQNSDRDRSRSADRAPGGSRSSRSRSNSRTRLAKTLSLDMGAGKDDDVPLSRTSSRVTTSAGSPPPAGILLNPVSPPPNGPLATSPSSSFYGTQSAASSRSNLDIPSTSSSVSTSRPPLNRQHSDTSSSYSQVGPATPATPSFPPAHTPSNAPPLGPAPEQKLPRQSTIRFAPLPEIRPRSYSTGRNVWVVDDDDPDGSGAPSQRRTRLVRVGSDVDADDGDGDALEFALDDDGADDRGGKWGSWSETLAGGMWGLSPSTSRRSNISVGSGPDDDALSVSSSVVSAADGSAGGSAAGGSNKLLKAFGLGRSRSKKKRTGAEGGGGPVDDALSRTSSADSEVSRRSSVDVAAAPSTPISSRPMGSTGIPMRKASTWEVGDQPSAKSQSGGPVYYASPARTARRRANYPPVAQRSRHAGGSRGRGPPVVQVEEPKFSEWGAGGVGGRGGAADEDDGSGMAWLKKRRLEREQAERERKEREAQEAEAQEASGEGVGEDQPEEEVDDEDEDEEPPAPAPPASSGVPLPSHLEAFRRGRQAPVRSGTLDSTTSTASTIRPATPPTPPVVSGLSATRPALVIEVPSRPSSSTPSPGSEDTPVTSPVGDEDDEGSSSDEEEEDEEEKEEEDDDDLCAEELAHEEALAEEARRSAKSMGAERYHSAKHENEIKVVEPSKHKPLPSPRLA